MDGYDLIGKTGTASIYENGKYLTGSSDYIYSFAGLYPGDDPEIIIYIAIKKPKDANNYMAPAVKDVLVNTSKYLNLGNNGSKALGYEMGNYINKTTTEIVKELENKNIKVLTLGTGNKIIEQYPSKGIKLYDGDLVVLRTNSYDKIMVDLNGLSYKEAKSVLDLMDVEYTLSGYGYVVNQNISVGDKIDKKVEVELKEKW